MTKGISNDILESYEQFDEYPTESDHHHIQSFSLGWNLGRLETALKWNKDMRFLTYESVSNTLLHSLLIINDSSINLKVIDEIEATVEELITLEKDPDELIDDDFAEELEENINSWQEKYMEEIGERDSILVVENGVINTRHLVREPDQIFDQDCWAWLPADIKSNLTDSMKALAVDIPTASMFLSLRSVEASLRIWYEQETGDEIQYGSWGSVLDRLESEFDQENGPAVLNNLDYLRDKRNDVAHPDIQPDWSHAEDTLFIVRRTITEIHSEIN
ncbi:hypothetical protein [Natronoarchaeum rubrum]|uniref:hypothetical protein n=1 Tax=Natronoarchaeum rubrum TaxID=755311 RepID=UPI00211376F9|nr:hypothetical protein [Natronoarchaeum rubrum]